MALRLRVERNKPLPYVQVVDAGLEAKQSEHSRTAARMSLSTERDVLSAFSDHGI